MLRTPLSIKKEGFVFLGLPGGTPTISKKKERVKVLLSIKDKNNLQNPKFHCTFAEENKKIRYNERNTYL
jgi:hypothetical protein